MNKCILYTQRVEIVAGYGERRDCADQNIPRFLEACGYIPVPVPNVISAAKSLFTSLEPAGIVFTGGNSLSKYGGDAPERDEVERCLLEMAIKNDIPVYGFCRGMQVILDYFGCELQNVSGHVAKRHTVSGILGELEVNSYHNQGAVAVTDELEILAKSEDGVVEAVRHKQYNVTANMWHPERETPFRESDIRLLQSCIDVKNNS